MSKDKRILEEVEKTLASMDRLEKLEAGPYFYTRIEGRLREASRKRIPLMEKIGGLVLKPAALTLIIVFNVLVTVMTLQGLDEPAIQKQISGAEKAAAVFAEDYSLTGETRSFEEYLGKKQEPGEGNG